VSSSNLKIETAQAFEPLLAPSRYKGAHGGRGSGKSHFFAELLIEDGLRFPGEANEGLRALAGREIQKSLKQSAKFLLESKLKSLRLGEKDGFKVFTSVIETPGGGIIDFQGLQDHTADSIKSYEGFHRFWGEEAQTISDYSLALLRPTIRWESERLGLESEIWFSWNPRRRIDPVDDLLRHRKPTNSIVVEANWRDNPWFPKVLEQERLDCLRDDPDQYDHIWEGGYATVRKGAYYANNLQVAKQQRRIGVVEPDPLMTFRAFADIGGTGAKADNFVFWVCQFIGKQILAVDHYEVTGQPLSAHLAWLRDNGYTDKNTSIWLPHDGQTNDKVHDVSYESALRGAGYDVEVVPNQGKGAAKARVEATRRIFNRVWFDKQKTDAGLAALGWYHEKWDEQRNIGLGPEHDWASHSSDAFGLMAIVYESHNTQRPREEPEYDAWGRVVGGRDSWKVM
jgi:phage terminase large subunit